jgi:sulfate adenylyltransferase subunit 1
MDVLRFITAGSVDDGKSTLIGRLLYDSNSVSTDILETIEQQTKNKGNGKIDLSLLTDGLRAEREQSITIDVAYKYFTTAKRKFIIADTPGHAEYTSNMFTGASTANLAIILIDIRNGIVEQTRRHTYIASLLQIPNMVVCVNKMDLIDFSEQKFNEIVVSYQKLITDLNFKEIIFIPVSAVHGDNVVTNSKNTPWYKGKNLLQHLEEVEVNTGANTELPRFQVQYIIRQNTKGHHAYKGYAGKIASGTFNKGDKVVILPSGIETEISAIEINTKAADNASIGQSVVLQLKDDIDIHRGHTIALKDKLPVVSQEIAATICWMDPATLHSGKKLLLQHYSNLVNAVVTEIKHKINLTTLRFEGLREEKAELNEIVTVHLKTDLPLAFDRYQTNRNTGGFILIDEQTNSTVAAGFFKAK